MKLKKPNPDWIRTLVLLVERLKLLLLEFQTFIGNFTITCLEIVEKILFLARMFFVLIYIIVLVNSMNFETQQKTKFQECLF